MGMKNAILSLSITAILTICAFNSVAAAPVSKQTTDIHSNYPVDVRGNQQTYLTAYLGMGDTTAVTIGIGRSTYLTGVLSSGRPLGPPSPTLDFSHGIPNAMVYIQSMNSDGKTWNNVCSERTLSCSKAVGVFKIPLTSNVAGVYAYKVEYDGSSQYAPAVSNVVTLTVTNVAIS